MHNFTVYFVANYIIVYVWRETFTKVVELYGLKRGSLLFKNGISLVSTLTSFIHVFDIGRTVEMTALITRELFAPCF